MLPDVVVVGAGIAGAACAEALSAAGVRVTVLDRGAPASGTTAAGEGNVLISDKAPGPELALAQASLARWPVLLESLEADVEWQAKGGLVVALSSLDALTDFASGQRAAGVRAEVVSASDALALEPGLTPSVVGGVYYPEDAQLQPVLAATALLGAVRRRGGSVLAGVTALGMRPGGVMTSVGFLPCGAVVNACGPWAGEFGAAAGAPLAVMPRRGMILVLACPLYTRVIHKVYDADYVGAVESSDADLQTSTVVESTMAGSVLVGSSRERVGFDSSLRVDVLRVLARKAVRLFPPLAEVPVIRAYGGFRPYVADHLPVIGADPRVPGLWHVTGHEGAGIGLAAGTGQLFADLFLGREPVVDPAPFRVDRDGVMV
ncbi:FAD-binding oxidoreductase [Actinocrispum sp. NPDC049592]|uniref:NAD(P)/FAD-dependent oxidoreductase n=1 Tax=Actinocrispum sp. NPDC049592 TaxID=3154835 RepID=UPI003420069D